MGFAINPSLNYLDIPEQYIVEIHQSAAEIVLPDARFRGHPFEAYICIARVEKEMKAYVALQNNALKSTLVYTSDFIAKTPQDYPRVLAEAEKFVTSMGFTLQKVNLDFSPAMREVIIKGLRVMRPPTPQKRTPVRQPKIDVPADLIVSTGLDEVHPVETDSTGPGAGMTELLSLRAELASARAALERITREKVAAEQHNAGEKSALKAACEQALESKRLAEERLSQAVQQMKKLGQAAAAQQDTGELQRLQQQLGTAAAGVAAAEKAREQLHNELQGERQKSARLGEEKGQLEKRLEGESQRYSALRTETAERERRLESQLADARTAGAEAAAKMAAMAGAEQSWREAQQREEELRRRSAATEAELATARGELEDLRHKLGQADELGQRLALTDAELVTVRQEIADLRGSRSLAEELREQLAASTAELAVSREQLMASAAEIERLRQEQDRAVALRQQAEEAGEELAALQKELAEARDEIKRLTELPATALPPAGEVTAEELIRLKGEKEAVEAEYVRLATESRVQEAELSENLSIAEAEVERLTSELEIQGQVAAMEQAALRAELRRLIVEGGAAYYAPAATAEPLQPVQSTAAAPTVAKPAPPEAVASPAAPQAAAQELQMVELLPETEEEGDDSPDVPIVADIAIMQEFTGDFGGFYSGGGTSTTEFRIDPSIDTICYSDPAEVVAVFYSSNSVQAVPDGKGIQRCKGYIVATKAAGSYRVYVAWHLTESGRVVVCLPEQQPVDSEECVLTLKDAVSYFEIVGFMMEVTDLGSTRQSYRKALQKIPVLKKTPSRE